MAYNREPQISYPAAPPLNDLYPKLWIKLEGMCIGGYVKESSHVNDVVQHKIMRIVNKVRPRLIHHIHHTKIWTIMTT